MPLLVATNNRGKLKEFRALLQPVELAAPGDLGLDLEVEENGDSFAANATLKARAFAAASGLVALADDSGLEVDALGGAPGIHSARYGGRGLDDMGRCRLLLEQLAEAGGSRSARFRCCLVAAAPDGRTCRAEGVCPGTIAPAPAGDGGFGYDPVFYLPRLRQTMAQVPAGIKNRISHRARALRIMAPLLLRTFPELGA